MGKCGCVNGGTTTLSQTAPSVTMRPRGGVRGGIDARKVTIKHPLYVSFRALTHSGSDFGW